MLGQMGLVLAELTTVHAEEWYPPCNGFGFLKWPIIDVCLNRELLVLGLSVEALHQMLDMHHGGLVDSEIFVVPCFMLHGI